MISIVITTYNAESTISETISSVEDQTFKGYELIIIDDGSTDNTIRLIEERQTTFSKLTLYSQSKIGRSRALNLGISKAKFDWIAIIDADDLWHPRKLDVFEKFITKMPETAIFCSLIKSFNLHPPKHNTIETEEVLLKKIGIKQLIRYNYVCHSSVVMQKSIAHYNIKRARQVDYDLWLKIANEKGKIVLIEEELTYRRIHLKQSFEGKSKLDYRISAIKLTQEYALKNKYYLTYLWIPIFYFLGYFKQILTYKRLLNDKENI